MDTRPNLLLITTHDTGRHFGCYGIPTLNTPTIDRLAAEGVRLTNYFAVVPICAASRVTMLTGLYPQTHGQLDLPLWGYEFHDGVRHLSHHLRDAGYQTHLFGHQHETAKVERLGFEQLHAQVEQGKPRPTGRDVAAQVAEFLKQGDRSRPFYAQVGFMETHSPFTFGDAPADHSRGVFVPPYIKPTGPAYELMAQFQGAVRQVDLAVEIIERALRESGLADNTLLIFTTDHGLELPRGKWNLYDPGVEIALVARWPAGGIGSGRTCDLLASNLDFTPTVLDLLDIASHDPLQGKSLAAAWRGQSHEPIHDAIFGYYSKSDARSVRTNRHKLILNASIRAFLNVPFDLTDTTRNRGMPPVELYDLAADPLESKNLSNDPAHAELRDSLLARLWQWLEQVDDDLLRGPPRSPWYDRAMASYQQWKQGEDSPRSHEDTKGNPKSETRNSNQ